MQQITWTQFLWVEKNHVAAALLLFVSHQPVFRELRRLSVISYFITWAVNGKSKFKRSLCDPARQEDFLSLFGQAGWNESKVSCSAVCPSGGGTGEKQQTLFETEQMWNVVSKQSLFTDVLLSEQKLLHSFSCLIFFIKLGVKLCSSHKDCVRHNKHPRMS